MNHSLLIYVVEDNDWYNKLLVHTLSLNPEFKVKSFFTGAELKNALADKPDLVTLDYKLPDTNGEELLKYIRNIDENINVVIISEQEELETAIQLLKAGAYDYIVKSKDIRDRLLNTVSHIQKNNRLITHLNSLQSEVERKYDFERTIIGNSSAMKQVQAIIKKALDVNITVSISGETGTGKEVIAKAIHYNSNRKSKPFVAVNMAAIPSDLIESELFGHEKGAFTGAQNRRIGKFEEAHGGTLFLDEIGEMEIGLQQKLLRVLQEREIVRIGSNEPVKVDCRIIVATHKDLAREVKKGKFREDLYYRIKGLPIHLPPLREREHDSLILAKHFLDLFCIENKLIPKKLSEQALQKIRNYYWPGNVRELKSAMELAAVLSNGDEIDDEDIHLQSGDNIMPDLMAQDLSMREYNRKIVNIYMERFNNNTKAVADRLGIGQTTVYRLLNEDKKIN